MKRGLEIGPGDSPLKSNGMICWDTMASSTMSEVKSFKLTVDFHDVVWGCNSIPVAADYYDEIYASHVIEHVDWRLVGPALREARRVLKRGGTIEIWTVDVRKLVDAYLRGECGDDWRRGNPRSNPFVWFVGRLHAYGPPDGAPDNWHRGQFDAPYLRRMLHEWGFVDIEQLVTRVRGTSHGPCEMGFRGAKL